MLETPPQCSKQSVRVPGVLIIGDGLMGIGLAIWSRNEPATGEPTHSDENIGYTETRQCCSDRYIAS